MATFACALAHVKQHLDQLVDRQQILQLCRQHKHAFRQRECDPATTIHLLLLQLLAQVSFRGLRRVAQVAVSAQALCAARMRLPLAILMELVDRSGPQTVAAGFKGLSVYIADAMGFMTPDTPELAACYGKGKNQRGSSQGYPIPKLLALMDLEGGFVHRAITLPWHRQEYTCLSRLFAAVGKTALLLGDRGLVSFTHLALMTARSIHGCFRLPKGQVVFGRGKPSRRLVRRLGKQDLLVRWRASQRPKWLSLLRWRAIKDQQLELRQIAFRVCRKGFRTHWAWIITTLTNPSEYSAQELIDLYTKRWQIEMYLPYCLHCMNFYEVAGRGFGVLSWAA